MCLLRCSRSRQLTAGKPPLPRLLSALSSPITLPACHPPTHPPLLPTRYVALVSGLGVGDEQGSPLRLQLLVDYLSGLLGGDGERAGVVGKVARVVIAGGLLKTNADLSQPTAYATVRQQAAALGPVRWVGWGGAVG